MKCCLHLDDIIMNDIFSVFSPPPIACSNSTIEMLEYGVKFSKLAIKTPKPRQSHCNGVFFVELEQMSHLALVILLLVLNK